MPLFFVLTGDELKVTQLLREKFISFQLKPLELKSFDQHSVSGCYFRNWGELKQAAKILRGAGLRLWEEDITPPDRYLMERFITASVEVFGQPDQDGTYRNPKLKPPSANQYFWPKLTMASLDIETSPFYPGEPIELYSIALVTQEKSYLWIKNSTPYLFNNLEAETYCFASEKELLLEFIDAFANINPDLILGWNVVNFDLRVLQNKCDDYGIAFEIGRGSTRSERSLTWRQPRNARGEISDQKWLVDITGRRILDGIDSLRTAMYMFDSFALEDVAQTLLGRGKLIHDASNRVEEITRLFAEEPFRLAQYNLEDCQLVLDIFEHCELLNLLMARSELTGHSLDRSGGSAAAFNYLYLPRLHRKGFVAPSIGTQELTFHAPGGYVMDSKPGFYSNVLVLDFKSLYPSIIRTFFIDPYGMIRALHGLSNQTQEGFDGAVFDKEDHLLPAIIDFLWNARDQAKKQKNQPLSQAVKILMNSFYGVLGSDLCRFYDPRLSSSITKRGHEIMQLSKEWIEQQGFNVLYGDTDSLFIWIETDVSSAQAKEIGEQLMAGLNHWWTEQLKNKFQIESKLEIEFETHFKKFLMPTIRGTDKGSKKRYAGLIESSAENYELVFKGLETVRSDWTELAKEFQKELYRRVFFDEPVHEYIQQFVTDLYAGHKDNLIVYRRRLRKPLEEYVKNIPPHAQAAKIAREIDPKFPINRIEYVLTVSGVEPLAFMNSKPDYDQYIEKQIQPVADSVLQFIGLSFEEVSGRQISLI